MQFSQSELAGSQPVFLLTIDFASQVFRFSNMPVVVANDAGREYQFAGSLDEMQIAEQTEMIGIDLESNSAQIACVFDGINLIEYWRRGFVLEGAKGELSMIIQRDGANLHTWENRIILMTGLVQQPVFGDPLEPDGFCSFTLERKPFDSTDGGLLLNPDHKITAQTFPTLDFDILTESQGQIYPLVFAEHEDFAILGNRGNKIYLYHTPAYAVSNWSGSLLDPYFVLISAYEVEANKVRVIDQKGNAVLCAVSTKVDGLGNIYSVADIGSNQHFDIKTSATDDDPTYLVDWSDWIGGGILSPFGAGPLAGGADLVMWAMIMGGYSVDLPAWQALRPFLNAYLFHGFIDDITVTAWDWISSNIIEFLPIEVQNGNNGMRPILALLYSHVQIVPITTFTTGPDFALVSAITTITDTSDIYNDISLQYGLNGDGNYILNVRISYQGFFGSWPIDARNANSEYALLSQGRYGRKSQVIEADYIYNRDVAIRVVRDKLRIQAFPLRSCQMKADIRYGFLQVGDIISLTSTELFLIDTKCVIVQREWGDTNWLFTLAIEDTPSNTQRYV